MRRARFSTEASGRIFRDPGASGCLSRLIRQEDGPGENRPSQLSPTGKPSCKGTECP